MLFDSAAARLLSKATGGNRVTGNAVHARAELSLLARLSALGTAKRRTKASCFALPGLILLADKRFTVWALRHEYEHIRQIRRYSPLGVLLLLAWHYGIGYLSSIAPHRSWPDFWQLWPGNPLEKRADAAVREDRPLPFMFGELPEE